MEKLVGETLADRIAAEGGLPFDDVIDMLVQVLSGLVAAHEKGIVHRDIKPENVFLTRRVGCPPLVQAARLRRLEDDRPAARATRGGHLDLTRTGMVMGTPYLHVAGAGARRSRTSTCAWTSTRAASSSTRRSPGGALSPRRTTTPCSCRSSARSRSPRATCGRRFRTGSTPSSTRRWRATATTATARPRSSSATCRRCATGTTRRVHGPAARRRGLRTARGPRDALARGAAPAASAAARGRASPRRAPSRSPSRSRTTRRCRARTCRSIRRTSTPGPPGPIPHPRTPREFEEYPTQVHVSPFDEARARGRAHDARSAAPSSRSQLAQARGSVRDTEVSARHSVSDTDATGKPAVLRRRAPGRSAEPSDDQETIIKSRTLISSAQAQAGAQGGREPRRHHQGRLRGDLRRGGSHAAHGPARPEGRPPLRCRHRLGRMSHAPQPPEGRLVFRGGRVILRAMQGESKEAIVDEGAPDAEARPGTGDPPSAVRAADPLAEAQAEAAKLEGRAGCARPRTSTTSASARARARGRAATGREDSAARRASRSSTTSSAPSRARSGRRDVKAVADGLAMVLQQFVDTLGREGIATRRRRSASRSIRPCTRPSSRSRRTSTRRARSWPRCSPATCRASGSSARRWSSSRRPSRTTTAHGEARARPRASASQGTDGEDHRDRPRARRTRASPSRRRRPTRQARREHHPQRRGRAHDAVGRRLHRRAASASSGRPRSARR